MDPVKALGRTGMLGGFVNKFDGGVEILDDLDDHWTAKHHKDERNWFVQELQELAAEKSVRITILGGDVHLCAIGQFYSNKKLGIPKDQDHRYMPNVISSAIVNTPPSDMVADVLNKRNKIHHLDEATDEDMIAMFPEDVNNKPRNNNHLLPRRNWCSIREYLPAATPPHTPLTVETPPEQRPPPLTRTLSLTRGASFAPRNLIRRLSKSGRASISTSSPPPAMQSPEQQQQHQHQEDYFNSKEKPSAPARASMDNTGALPHRPNPFLRRPTGLTNNPDHVVDLQQGLDIRLNVENAQGDPAGTTSEYRLLVPALDYQGAADINPGGKPKGKLRTFFETVTERGQASPPTSPQSTGAHSVRTSGTMSSDGKSRRDSLSPPRREPASRSGPTAPATSAPTRSSMDSAGYPRHGPPNQAAPKSYLPPDVGYVGRGARSAALPPGVGPVHDSMRTAATKQPPPGVIQRTAFPSHSQSGGAGRGAPPTAYDDGRRRSVDMGGSRRSGGYF